MLKYIVVVVVLFFCVMRSSSGCKVPSGRKYLTVERRVKDSSYVFKGYLINKISVNNSYTACLYITTVYKGNPNGNSICADKFGSSASCKTDLNYGVEYLFFLEKPSTVFEARYTSVDRSAVRFNKNVQASLRSAICTCPTHFKKSRCNISNMVMLCYRAVGHCRKNCYCRPKRKHGRFGAG